MMEMSPTQKNSFATNYAIGAAAAGIMQVFFIPLDVLRWHRYNPNTYRGYNYSSTQLARELVKTKGSFALWKGFAWIIPKDAIFQGILFATKEHLNVRYRQDKEEFYERWVCEKFFSGGVAGFFCQILLSPVNFFERILIRDRNYLKLLNKSEKIVYAKEILSDERLTAQKMYRGMNLAVAQTALYFGFYDWARDGRTPEQKASFWSNLSLATATTLFGKYLIYPIQTIYFRR